MYLLPGMPLKVGDYCALFLEQGRCAGSWLCRSGFSCGAWALEYAASVVA